MEDTYYCHFIALLELFISSFNNDEQSECSLYHYAYHSIISDSCTEISRKDPIIHLCPWVTDSSLPREQSSPQSSISAISVVYSRLPIDWFAENTATWKNRTLNKMIVIESDTKSYVDTTYNYRRLNIIS